jgi:hypothetical protein
LHFINHSGFPSDRTMLEPGTWEYRIYIDPQADQRNPSPGPAAPHGA